MRWKKVNGNVSEEGGRLRNRKLDFRIEREGSKRKEDKKGQQLKRMRQ